MSKGGSAPAGTTTVNNVTNNPTQNAQLPYLTGQAGMNNPNDPTANLGWNQAVNLAVGDPFQYYPGQTLANFHPAIPTGYQDLINNGANVLPGLSGSANNAFANGIGGGYSVYNSPAYGYLNSISQGAGSATPQSAALTNVGNLALPGNPTAAASLTATANGDYLNSNPYLNGMFNAASDAVTRGYQTATAPQTDSNFEASGRYGSGALANAQTQNQLNLGQTLNNLASNIYGQNYENERGLQTNAASALGSLANQNAATAASAYNAAGGLNLGNLGAINSALGTMQGGFQAGNTAANQALLMEPNVLSGNLAGSNALVQGGQGLTSLDQQQINDAMQRFYGVQNAPWQTNSQYLNMIGQPTTGSTNSQTTQPYFQNQLANVLGAGVGGLGLFNGLNTATGGSLGSGLSSALGGIFGSSALPAASYFSPIAGSLGGLADFAGGGDVAAGFAPLLLA